MSSQSQRGRRVQAAKRTQSLRIFYWVIGAVVIMGAAFLITVAVSGGFNTPEVEQITVTPVNAPVGTTPEGFYYKGDPDAPVKVIDYSDFQCPACAAFSGTLGQDITRDYVETGKVQFIYHDLPLSQHINSVKASEASRCAGEQDSFWPMHDVLFARQTEWAALSSPVNQFTSYAAGIGLNRGEFESCLNSGKYTTQVAQAGQVAAQVGVSSTPSFIVNGSDPIDSTELVAAIEAALAAANE
ncbi:MAG: DsbA family protein [Chloroflexales bacterium]|nr:DsbA family protein [Chloroflexales bacterium]